MLFLPFGGSYLWQAGEPSVVRGAWALLPPRDQAREPTLCYRYGGGELLCRDASVAQRAIVARVAGDPFGLAKGEIPFAMPPGRVTLDDLLARAGAAG